MAFGPDQSSELRMLSSDHDDGHVSSNFSSRFLEESTVQLEYFNCSVLI